LKYKRPDRFLKDESGAVLVENTVTILTFFLILFGIIDFTYLYYQWNAATKAVQYGARIAAVSDPVDGGLRSFTGLTGSLSPGDDLGAAAFGPIICSSSNAAGTAVACQGALGAVNASAFQRIVYGAAGRTACATNPAPHTVGMCNAFTAIRANNIEIVYAYTGLGFAARPGGAVPTITVRLRSGANALPFDFIMVGGLAGLAQINLPAFSTTVTGEDMNIAPPA
jgi:Flp pilus assembly pilin Flp